MKPYTFLSDEKEIQNLWQKEKIYAFDQSRGPIFSIDTPPPTVSGSLHIGHIFSYTQTDIISRYKRLQGRAVLYPIGFDDNGLATERFVEKKNSVTAQSMPRSAFIQLCLQETAQAEKEFERVWKAIGLSVDWKYTYSTIASSTRKISQESFVRLYQQGHIYRKSEPALYCTACRTSVAQAELDDAHIASSFNDVRFLLTDGTPVTIATTRPELLPSCVALLYHPSDNRYTGYAKKEAIVPIFGQKVPLVADDMVDPEKGTGLVMCCTFGDKTDVYWFKKHKFPLKQSIELTGTFCASTGPLAGLKVGPARAKVLDLLKEAGALEAQKPITHTVNVHERCKREIEYAVLTQWFLAILEHKQRYIALADQITWHPEFMKKRYQNWVENLTWDWCLSRQRYFGIPFPVWHCVQCHEIVVADIQQLPIDPQEQPYTGTCPKCKGSQFIPDTDVMDTWNTSSLTPYLCYALLGHEPFAQQARTFLPMSMRPQAHDIIRTWALYTIIKTALHHDTVPWKEIVISGHVLSSAKEKLSKSKENAAHTPEQLLQTYPADAIRYWTASASLGHDVPFSEGQLKIGNRLVTKLYNAFKFVHEHTQNAPPVPEKLGPCNEWILDRVHATYTTYTTRLETHEFSLALDCVEQFFWKQFCDNYLELIKDQLFNPDQYSSSERAATQWTLHHVGLRILQLYAPYIPYITEYIYQHVYRTHVQAPSIHLTYFDQIQVPHAYATQVQTMEHVLALVGQVRRLKTEQQLSLKHPITTMTVHVSAQVQQELRGLEQLLKGTTRAQRITYSSEILEHPTLVADQAQIGGIYDLHQQ